MKIRFLHTAPSENPDFPFQAGQVIEVARLTSTLRAALKPQRDGTILAVLVQDEGPEAAVIESVERAVLPRAKGRR